MNKISKVRIFVTHLLVAAWMLVIFSFSAQPGEESADLSGGISHLFMKIWNWIFQLGWDEGKLLQMTEIWDLPIRKLAHMTEFGILALLLFAAIRGYARINTERKRYVFAWIGAVCYAATDEFHQLFVPGRSGNVIDVCVDATGACLALVFLYGIMKLCNKIRKR